MANKYIIEGATYCGDGTASNEAASAGAAGAWNNINVFEGTAPAYGTLAAGDLVYIRSKTYAGADIVRTVSGSNPVLGSASATSANWITWVVDGGTVWPGISGVLRYNHTGDNFVTARNYNRFVAEAPESLAFRGLHASPTFSYTLVTLQTCVIENALFDWSAAGGGYGYGMIVAAWSNARLINPKISVNGFYDGVIKSAGDGSKLRCVNPQIELTALRTNVPVFYNNGSNLKRTEVVGGRIYGAGATTGAVVIDDAAESLFVGVEFPKTMSFCRTTYRAEAGAHKLIGADGGAGAVLVEPWGTASSRADGYPPTLTAFLPNSTGTPWAWWIFPANPTISIPFSVPSAKIYTAAPETKTLTAEVLVADSITTATKATLWIEVEYIDNTTGESKFISSRVPGGGALTSSTAAWDGADNGNDMTYGAINLVKRKLSVTTPTAIKQDSLVKVSLVGTVKAASANDILFFCPDVSLS